MKFVDAVVVGLEVDFHVFRFRKDGNSRGGCVNSSFGFRVGYALYSMSTTFVLQLAINRFAREGEHDFLETAQFCRTGGEDFQFPGFDLAVFFVHLEQVAREQRRFVTTRTGADFHHAASPVGVFAATGIRAQWNLPRRCAGVAAAVLVLSIISEAAQIPGRRDASLHDLLSDWLGAAGFLLLGIAFLTSNTIGMRRKSLLSVAGVTLLIFPLVPLITVSAAYIERNHQLPALVNFDSWFGDAFIRTQHATVEVIGAREANSGAAKVSLNDGAWPGLIFHDIWPDWRPYTTLIVQLGLTDDIPLSVNIRIHDGLHRLHDQPYHDRFNMTYELQPGFHTLRIPIEQILNAPMTRQMDLSQIDGIVIFCSRRQAGRTFHLTEIRLE